MLSSAFQGLGNVCPKFGIFTLPIMQFVFPDCLGEVPEAIAYKCFKLNWFDFHWVKKGRRCNIIGKWLHTKQLRRKAHRGAGRGGGTSQLLFLARHRHCLGIGSQLDNAANLFIIIIYNEIISCASSSRLSTMFAFHQITLSYNIRFLMIDEMSQSKLVNHWKVRNFPSGDNCRQIRIQDTLGGQWWLNIFTRRI